MQPTHLAEESTVLLEEEDVLGNISEQVDQQTSGLSPDEREIESISSPQIATPEVLLPQPNNNSTLKEESIENPSILGDDGSQGKRYQFYIDLNLSSVVSR